MEPLKDVVYVNATAAEVWLPRQQQMPHHAHCRPRLATDDTANNTRRDINNSICGKRNQHAGSVEAKGYDDDDMT